MEHNSKGGENNEGQEHRELPLFDLVWTRIFHVRPHSIGETRFLFICENLIFWKKVGVATYFIFIFEGKIKQEIKP